MHDEPRAPLASQRGLIRLCGRGFAFIIALVDFYLPLSRPKPSNPLLCIYKLFAAKALAAVGRHKSGPKLPSKDIDVKEHRLHDVDDDENFVISDVLQFARRRL